MTLDWHEDMFPQTTRAPATVREFLLRLDGVLTPKEKDRIVRCSGNLALLVGALVTYNAGVRFLCSFYPASLLRELQPLVGDNPEERTSYLFERYQEELLERLTAPEAPPSTPEGGAGEEAL